MIRRRDTPYRDRIEQDGSVLIYEGHDIRIRVADRTRRLPTNHEKIPAGALTQNGLLEKGFLDSSKNGEPWEVVAVYEKIHRRIWAFNRHFQLTDVWQQTDGPRKVFKFRLELVDSCGAVDFATEPDLEQTRVIPPQGNWKFWKRDQGRCVVCQAEDNLHFDHELPYSKSGTRLPARNIRLPRHVTILRRAIELNGRIRFLRFRLCPRESTAQRTVAALAATFASNSCGSVA
jgi:hypothetical protein